MGNVFAASVAAAAAPPLTIPEPPPPPRLGSENLKNSNEGEWPHPGVMEDLHKRTKDVFPMNFEGVKLMVNKGLSNHFQVVHTIQLGSVSPAGYRFGATYVGTKQTGPNEAFPVLLGDIDPSGNMNANIVHQISDRVRVKMGCQILKVRNQPLSATHFQADYKGDQYSASLTFANIDLANDSGLVVAHYLKSVTRRVALGAELACQFNKKIPGNEIALMSVAGRYDGNENVFSGTVGLHAVHLCFYQKASEQLQVGCELDTNFRTGESTATIGYQVDLPKADLVFRGMVDSNWNVGAVLEKKLGPMPFTFSLSSVLNHSKQNFRLGCGFIIG